MTKTDDISELIKNETVTKKTENTICTYCNKKYSAYTHMRRHLKTCKQKLNAIKENEELKQEMEEMRQSLNELKKLMLDMINKKCKMHPKTLQKMINSNNTINNNIQYVELGDEELHKVFIFALQIEKKK
jgi:ribosomal protein L19E